MAAIYLKISFPGAFHESGPGLVKLFTLLSPPGDMMFSDLDMSKHVRELHPFSIVFFLVYAMFKVKGAQYLMLLKKS